MISYNELFAFSTVGLIYIQKLGEQANKTRSRRQKRIIVIYSVYCNVRVAGLSTMCVRGKLGSYCAARHSRMSRRMTISSSLVSGERC